jgi:hypothetical protein
MDLSQITIQLSKTNNVSLREMARRAAVEFSRKAKSDGVEGPKPRVIINLTGSVVFEFITTNPSLVWRIPLLPDGNFGEVISNRFTISQPSQSTIEDILNDPK